MHLNMVNINFTYENTIFHFTNIDYQFHYNRNTIYYIHKNSVFEIENMYLLMKKCIL